MSKFLLDVAAYRMGLLKCDQSSASAARTIIEMYLIKPTHTEPTDEPNPSRPPTLCRKLVSTENSSLSYPKWREYILGGVEDLLAITITDSGSQGLNRKRSTSNMGSTNSASVIPSGSSASKSRDGEDVSGAAASDGSHLGGSLTSPPSCSPTTQQSNNILCIGGEPVNSVVSQLPALDANARVSLSMFDRLDAIVFSCLQENFFRGFLTSPEWRKYLSLMLAGQKKVTEADFTLFRVLGRGGFGLVNGCKRNTSGKLYAMKMMNKSRVKLKRAEAFCVNERNILAAIDSPFLVCLKYSFTTQKELFLILDLMTGGDLGFHLQRKGTFSPEETLYFSARIVAGIAALHSINIVYRDLKPENVLMDENGNTKISDLGLACKMGKSGLSGACGTRGYWAPEMLRKDSAGKRERYFLQVDWFSFGCCLYEFLYGIGPFRTDRARKWGDFPKNDKADKDKAIDLATVEMDVDYDKLFFDDTTVSLLQGLLVKDPKFRLGAGGAAEIMAHPYFSKVNWDTLALATPPLKPRKDINMATQAEIGAFSDQSLSGKIVLEKDDHKHFEDWEFVSMVAFQAEAVEFLQYEEIYGEIKPSSADTGCCFMC